MPDATEVFGQFPIVLGRSAFLYLGKAEGAKRPSPFFAIFNEARPKEPNDRGRFLPIG